MAKQRQQKMQYRLGTLGALPELESRTGEQLMSESKHPAAARALLGARAAERYDAAAARKYFNEALAGVHPQERPALRQMMKAALGQPGGGPPEGGPAPRPDEEAGPRAGRAAPRRSQGGDGEARPGAAFEPPATAA